MESDKIATYDGNKSLSLNILRGIPCLDVTEEEKIQPWYNESYKWQDREVPSRKAISLKIEGAPQVHKQLLMLGIKPSK